MTALLLSKQPAEHSDNQSFYQLSLSPTKVYPNPETKYFYGHAGGAHNFSKHPSSIVQEIMKPASQSSATASAS